MTLEENRRRVAEEGETNRAASSPAAIMRTGSRVYIGALLHNRSLCLHCDGMGRGGEGLHNRLFTAERRRE